MVVTRSQSRSRRASITRRTLNAIKWTGLGIVAAGLLASDLGNFGVPHFPKAYVIRSGSMTGTFSTGAVVWDLPVSHHPVFYKGEIVTFYNPTQPGELLTHRIIGITSHAGHQSLLETKGDANKLRDPFRTPVKNVVGVYQGEVPYLGYGISFIQNRWAWLLEMLGATAAILVFVRWISAELKQESQP